MTWSRVPIFVWSIIATAALLTLASPVLLAAGLFGLLDKTAQTAFYVTEHGGSSYLWENLFWFFGHPEVYIMALPGFGIVGEILPVFTRKPLFAFRNRRGGNDWRGVAVLLRVATPPLSRVASTRTCGRCSCSRRNSSRSRPDSSSWWEWHDV